MKEDMARNQMTTEMAEDRKHWHVMIQAGTLRSVEAERSEKYNATTWGFKLRLSYTQTLMSTELGHTDVAMA